MGHSIYLTIVGVVALFPHLIYGQNPLGLGARVSVGQAPVSMGKADLDGDGHIDLLSANAGDGTISVLYNDGHGDSFRHAAYPVEGVPAWVTSGDGDSDSNRLSDGMKMTIGDFDGDGFVDVALTIDTTTRLTVLFNDGHGELGRQSEYEVETLPSQLSGADLDSDGRDDVAFCSLDDGKIGFLVNRGNGALELRQSSLDLGGSHAVCPMDLDQDGDVDLAVPRLESGVYAYLTLLLNLGSGTSWEVSNYQSKERLREDILAADFNGDGLLDLAALGEKNPLSLWLAEKPAQFGMEQVFQREYAYNEGCTADFDGNGTPDIVAVGWWPGGVYGWLNQGHGTWSTWDADALTLFPHLRQQPGRPDLSSIACGDWDGDGDEDVAVASRETSTLSLFYNARFQTRNHPPLAEAGPVQHLFAGDAASLNGLGSVDAENPALIYHWRQVQGKPVVLSDLAAVAPTFMAPSYADTLAFELRVSDGMQEGQPDTVVLPVLALEYASPGYHISAAQWESVFQGNTPVEAIVVDPYDAQTVYTGLLARGIAKSTDGGRSWSVNEAVKVERSPFLNHSISLALDPADRQHLFAGGETPGIFESKDGGEAWHPTGWGGYGVRFVGADLFLWGGEGRGLLKSEDGGQTFVHFNRNLPRTDVGGYGGVDLFEVDPVDPAIRYAMAASWWVNFYRTLNGEDWESPQAPDFFRSIRVLKASPHTRWLYAGMDGTGRNGQVSVYRSQRLGTDWQGVSTGLPQGVAVLDLTFDPEETLTVYAGTSQGVYWSGDGGEYWQPLAGGPESLVVKALALTPTEPRYLYVGTEQGVVYRVELQRDIATLVDGAPVNPLGFHLYPSSPNPFNSQTTITYQLSTASPATLAIYSTAGQQVATLLSGPRQAGIYSLQWDGSDDQGRELASGVYFCRLQAGTQVETRKLLLLR